MTTDQLKYIGALAAWLETCPDGKLEYGEYYPSRLIVTFDGEEIGQFVNDDPQWFYEEKEDMK